VDVTYKRESPSGSRAVGFVVFTASCSGHRPVDCLEGDTGERGVQEHQRLKEGDPCAFGREEGRVGTCAERVGHVTVTLNLDPEVGPTRTRAHRGLGHFLGAKYVDYIPASPTACCQPEPRFRASRRSSSRMWRRGGEERAGADRQRQQSLNPGQLATDIHNTLVATQRGMEALTKASTGPAVQQTQATLASLERVMAHLDTLLGAPTRRRRGKRLDTLSTNLTQLTTRLATDRLAQGLLDNMTKGRDAGEDRERYDAVQQSQRHTQVPDGTASRT